MRSLIIAICILSAILIFAIGNTIYSNMKLSALCTLAEQIDEDNLADIAPVIRKKWNSLSRYLRISVTDTKIRSASTAVERIYQISKGANEDLRIARANLIIALDEINVLERPTLSQIF